MLPWSTIEAVDGKRIVRMESGGAAVAAAAAATLAGNPWAHEAKREGSHTENVRQAEYSRQCSLNLF